MNIILFKIFATPLLIGSATLAGRRWGPVVNGLIVGLPLTTGPISFIIFAKPLPMAVSRVRRFYREG